MRDRDIIILAAWCQSILTTRGKLCVGLELTLGPRQLSEGKSRKVQKGMAPTLEVDPHVLLCLLAVRQFGGKSIPAKQDLFSKGLKAPLKIALEKGWLQANKIPLQLPGKTKLSKVDVLDLTADGEVILRHAAHPEVLAAAATGQIAELHRQLEDDRQQLKAEIRSLLSAKKGGKGKADAVEKEAAALSKTVGELAKRLGIVEAALQSRSPDPVLQKIDDAFMNLLNRLQQMIPQGTAARMEASSPQASFAPGGVLRTGLRQAYDALCQLIEFEDRLVPIPRLYHQARNAFPDLSVAAFHAELQTLWDRRELELQVVNDPQAIKEPDKAIQRGDNKYYYVIWH